MMQAWTVSGLTRHIGQLFADDAGLSDVSVAGEISNFKHHSSGHMYFTLKDEESVIRCAMFRSANSRLRFQPGDGLRVLVHGSVSVYAAGGTYQLYPDRMEPDGLGSLYLAYEQRKAKLEKEGLFDSSIKRPIPFLPRIVGVVTSPTGAVIRDIRNVLFRRFPTASLLLAPSAVQGADAAAKIEAALMQLQSVPGVDVIILARGGGSLEDLWPFNDESLARAIRKSRVPVISAVGHETDFTIADFVADLRAPTPSAAAELAVPDLAALREYLAQIGSRNRNGFARRLEMARARVERLYTRPVFRRPLSIIDQRRQGMDGLAQRIRLAAAASLERADGRLSLLAGKLHALSPLQVLARGFAAVSGEDGGTLACLADVSQEERIRVRFRDGMLKAKVESLHPLDLASGNAAPE